MRLRVRTRRCRILPLPFQPRGSSAPDVAALVQMGSAQEAGTSGAPQHEPALSSAHAYPCHLWVSIRRTERSVCFVYRGSDDGAYLV